MITHKMKKCTYSAYRNPEWQQIRELLIDKARIESQDIAA